MRYGSNTGLTDCSRSPWLESAFNGFILNKNESMKVDGDGDGEGKGREGKGRLRAGLRKEGWMKGKRIRGLSIIHVLKVLMINN